jgi:hypothetical protein
MFKEIENGMGIDAFLNDIREKLVGKTVQASAGPKGVYPQADGT